MVSMAPLLDVEEKPTFIDAAAASDNLKSVHFKNSGDPEATQK